jgi:hypothetical protein
MKKKNTRDIVMALRLNSEEHKMLEEIRAALNLKKGCDALRTLIQDAHCDLIPISE